MLHILKQVGILINDQCQIIKLTAEQDPNRWTLAAFWVPSPNVINLSCVDCIQIQINEIKQR